MSLSSEQTSEQEKPYSQQQASARAQLLDELIAALRDTAPPPDAFSVNDIMERTGWEREQVYGYLKRARAEGKVELIGRFGPYSYYRKV